RQRRRPTVQRSVLRDPRRTHDRQQRLHHRLYCAALVGWRHQDRRRSMISSRRAFVPRAQTTDKRYYGVVEGIVVDVFDPDKEGKIKVRFPWFDDDMVTEYCRVCQLYAGNGYGALFVPEVGDEVLIGFIHGDMRLPIVLGGLYNGKDKPSSYRQKT